MDIVGLDLHKRASQLASTAPDGTITDRRIVTNRDRLTAVFGDRPRARAVPPSPRRSCGATDSACQRGTAAWCRRRLPRSRCHRSALTHYASALAA